MGLPYTPFTTPPCPEDLNDMLALFASRLSIPEGSARLVISGAPPIGSSDVLWYDPGDNTLNAYIGGSWNIISGGTWAIGDIVMFTGDVNGNESLASPAHPARRPWALCDGGTYSGFSTPNIMGRVPRGASTGHGSTGGADSQILGLNHVPAHQHGVPYVAEGQGSGAKKVLDAATSLTTATMVQSQFACGAGTDADHQVPADPLALPTAVPTLPKYTVLGFKVYIGFA